MPYGIQYRANISYMESLDEKGHMRNVMIYGKTDRRCDIQTVYVVAEVLGGNAGWRGRRARQGTGEGMRAGRRLPSSTVGRDTRDLEERANCRRPIEECSAQKMRTAHR